MKAPTIEPRSLGPYALWLIQLFVLLKVSGHQMGGDQMSYVALRQSNPVHVRGTYSLFNLI